MDADKEREWEDTKIGGEIWKIAEDEFSASFNRDKGVSFLKSLVEEFRKSGSRLLKTWAREKLSEAFPCVSSRPKWVNKEPQWPFHQEKPMVFIFQHKLIDNDVSDNYLVTEVTLFVFGARSQDEEGRVVMKYEVISDYHDF